MNAFIIFATVVAAASANPQVFLNNGLWGSAIGYNAYQHVPTVAHHQIVAPLATKTQYHAQDELGQASYGYSHPGQAHAEVRDASGNVRGSYAYINPNGKEVRVQYTAGHDGFRVASNDLPLGPVANPNVPVVANLVGPSPVQETPEVIQARAAHALAHQEALARSGRKKRQVAVIPTTHALGYNNVYTNLHGYNGYAYSAPVANVYASQVAHAYASPIAHTYASPIAHAYAAPVVSNVVSQPLREATLTKVVNTPGHAVSYRVD